MKYMDKFSLVPMALILALSWLSATSCLGPSGPVVVLYTSQDAVYTHEIIRQFEQESGIRVRVIHDSEAAKTVALTHRLTLEHKNPICDVFWSNEEMKAQQLAGQGILQKPITTTVFRSRQLVVNTNLIPIEVAPKSILSLTSPEWKDRICMAYPLYGTTATQFQVLRHQLGNTTWKSFCERLEANNPLVVDGNSHVVKLVGSGQRAIGLTDTDDVRVGLERGFPIAAWPDAQWNVRIFNSISLVQGAPHPSEAGILAAYLASEKVSHDLIAAGAADGLPDASEASGTRPDWGAILSGIDEASNFLKQTFLSP